METLALELTKKFIDREIINPDNKETYITGLKLILSDIINFSLIFLIGILTKSFIDSCIYLVVFWTVRKFSGGFHAKTYAVCRIVTVGTYILIFFAGKIIDDYYTIITLVCNIFAIVTMVAFVPVRHPNKVLTDKEIKANKLFALITTLFFALVSVALAVFNRKEGLVIALTLFAVTALIYAGLLKNRRKEGKCNVQNK
ncbi:MAG: accessory gene regulator B family protein [bacterium]|nr:accessory gene regulator B family protein [bacterium]